MVLEYVAVQPVHVSKWLCNKRTDGTRVLFNQYPSFMCSSIKRNILIPAFHVIVPRWIKKYGTRAHQARVPEKVVDLQ